MKDTLKAFWYNLIEITKRIGLLNYNQVNYLIEERLKKLNDLVYEMYDELEAIEIIIEDHQINTSRIKYEDRNAN